MPLSWKINRNRFSAAAAATTESWQIKNSKTIIFKIRLRLNIYQVGNNLLTIKFVKKKEEDIQWNNQIQNEKSNYYICSNPKQNKMIGQQK